MDEAQEAWMGAADGSDGDGDGDGAGDPELLIAAGAGVGDSGGLFVDWGGSEGGTDCAELGVSGAVPALVGRLVQSQLSLLGAVRPGHSPTPKGLL